MLEAKISDHLALLYISTAVQNSYKNKTKKKHFPMGDMLTFEQISCVLRVTDELMKLKNKEHFCESDPLL